MGFSVEHMDNAVTDFKAGFGEETGSREEASCRLWEDFCAPCERKESPGAGGAAERPTTNDGNKPSDGKKLPPFEIVDEKDPELKKEAAIKEAAQAIKNGKFPEQARVLLLEALNTGENDAARWKSLDAMIHNINKELLRMYKEEGVKDLSKQFEVRYLNLKGADGTYDRLRIGIQGRKSTDFKDSFLVRVKK